jgi:hypothetical protein
MAVQVVVGRPAPRWIRSYPPLVLLAVAVLVAALVLPSALNLPQSNPSTVLEYAPVPPEDDNPPPPADGNLSSLGLGSSSSLTAGGNPPPPPPPPPPPDEGAGSRPSVKRCVGDPPRQTEDPNSPPCVPFFDGDNFGATYQGVTREEITVLVYFDTAVYSTVGQGAGENAPAAGTLIDASSPNLPPCPSDRQRHPPEECDHVLVRVLKSFSKYFNDRFMTYHRKVHYWAYFSGSGSPAERRTDAQANWQRLKPFAVIDQAGFGGNNEAYTQAMAGRGVLTFSSTEATLRNAFYRESRPLSWGFWPDVEHWADQYSTYVCTKVAPYPVSHYGRNQGQGAPNGQPRKYGLFYTNDPDEPGLQHFAALVKEQLRQRCNVTGVERSFPESGYTVDGSDTGADQTQTAVAFQQNEVTTILYLGGVESKLSAALAAQQYYPEIVLAGDLSNDHNFVGTFQNQDSWKNAWATTFHIRKGKREETPGFQAYKEGYPSGPHQRDGGRAEEYYFDHFMLFVGIQAAGPRLIPEQVEAGFHAIPERASSDPFVAAFYFDPNDYTAVKDSAEQWWSVTDRPPGSNEPGCWKMVREGRRFIAGTWPAGDDAFVNQADPCTGFSGGINLRAG